MKIGLILLFLVGCGGGVPSSLDACKASCDTAKHCTQLTTDNQVAACKLLCDDQKAPLSNADVQIDTLCKNAADVHHSVFDCVMQCDVNGSQNACETSAGNTCIAK